VVLSGIREGFQDVRREETMQRGFRTSYGDGKVYGDGRMFGFGPDRIPEPPRSILICVLKRVLLACLIVGSLTCFMAVLLWFLK
jgi:hypothetical protein